MVDLVSVALVSTAIAIASVLSVRFKISSAIFEVAAGIVLGNFLGVGIDGWLDFLGTFGGLMLTFLAGAEIETSLMRKNLKLSLALGSMSFLAPLVGEVLFFSIFTGWGLTTILVASLALTTTSVAVVYAVLTEYDLLKLPLGGAIIAVTFVNDILTLVGVNLLSPSVNYFTVVFIALMVAAAVLVPRLLKRVVSSYGRRSVEVELRLIIALILLMALVADAGKLHAVFGVFLLGFLFANSIQKYEEIRSKIRTVTFALLSPAFFIKAGLLIDLGAVANSGAIILGALAAKLASKAVGTYPLTRKWLPEGAIFSTLMLSTGLTVGTITATLGLELGLLTRDQFTLVVIVVILSAVVPTLIAKRFIPRKL